jgi:hypothetical protein
MIASLTFTYGNERTELYTYKAKDQIDKYFRNCLDYNLLVFHNSSDDFIKKTKKSCLFNDFNFTFASIKGTYPQALKQALLFLKEKGITKIVFLQDDVFCLQKNTKIIDSLVQLLETANLEYLNLEYCYETFKDKLQTFNAHITTQDFNIFKTDTNFFKTATSWSWSFDDSPYYSTLDFALNTIYDDHYYSYPDIWSAEWYLKAKFDQINILRPITNVNFFSPS